MHVCLVNLQVLEHLFYGLNSRTEEILAQLLETSMGDEGMKWILEERVDFDGPLGGRGECSLHTFASGAETAESVRVGTEM